MDKGADDLPPGPYATTLKQVAKVESQIGDARHILDSSIYENVLLPLTAFLNGEVRELANSQKRVESKRLEYDRQRRKAHPSGQAEEKDKEKDKDVPKEVDELKIATEKFESATKETRKLMESMLNQEPQRVQNLKAFVDAQLAFHRACLPLLENLSAQLGASTPTRASFVAAPSVPPTTPPKSQQMIPQSQTPQPIVPPRQSIGTSPTNPPVPARSAPVPVPTPTSSVRPHCRALYDFPPENPGELGFRAGDTIYLFSQMDENWFEGELNGQTGLVPVTYVEVLQPL